MTSNKPKTNFILNMQKGIPIAATIASPTLPSLL